MAFWLVGAVLAQQLLGIPAQSLERFADGLYHHLASKSVFYYLGWYAVLRLVADSSLTRRATNLDAAVVLAVLVMTFASAPAVAWIAATIAGAHLLFRGRDDAALAAAGAVLLALSFNGLWGPKLFDVFAYHLLRADAAIVGSALSASQPGVTWSDTIVAASSDHSIVIYGPCSSFHNISLGLLCWVTLSRLARSRWIASDALVGLVVCLTVIVLNTGRLYLMALSADGFAYWHAGAGQQLFAWATTFAVLAVSLWGALRAGRA